MKYAGLVLNGLALYGSKMSILVLYLRVFSVQKLTRWAIFATMLFTFGVWLFTLITNSTNRAPAPGKSWIAKNLSRNETAQPTINKVSGFVILALDVLIFIIPMHASWNLQLSKTWKYKLLAMFATGSLAVVSAALSAYVRVSADYDYDRSWSGGLIIIYG